MAFTVRITDEDGSPINSNNPLPVVAGSDTLEHGVKDVASAGTAVQLADDVPCRQVIVTAKKDNTGSIYVGGSTVSSSSYGVELNAGDSIMIPVNNANLIYIDADVNGDGVGFLAV